MLRYLLVVLSLAPFSWLRSQEYTTSQDELPPFEYDILTIPIPIDGKYAFDLEIMYSENADVYINVEALFKSVHIAMKIHNQGDSLTGFVEQEKQTYSICYSSKQLRVGTKSFSVSDEIVKDFGSIYVESHLLKEAFGIEVIFQLRDLSAIIRSDFDFPLIQQLKLKKKQSTNLRHSSNIQIDSTIGRSPELFNAGVVDWAMSTVVQEKMPANHQLSANVGAEILYGQFTGFINSLNGQKPQKKDLLYQWKWVNNDHSFLRQATIGKLSTSNSQGSTSLIGIHIKNTPTHVRKARGYYYINETTQANWNVELYINNQLIDFQTADANGHFIFKIPIVYGYTQVTLKYYGLHGETRTEERLLNLPYTFLPSREFDYQLSVGKHTGKEGYSGKAVTGYGILTNLTVAGGIEFSFNTPTAEKSPFLKFAYQPFFRLILSGEHIFTEKTSAWLSYYLSRNTELKLYREVYADDAISEAITPKRTEHGVKLTLPYKLNKLNGFVRLDAQQAGFDEFTEESLHFIYSLSHQHFSFNSSTHLKRTNWLPTNGESELSFSYRFKGFSIGPKLVYNLRDKIPNKSSFTIEKQLSKGHLSLGYTYNHTQKRGSNKITFRWDLAGCRASFSAHQSKGRSQATTQLNGSLIFDNLKAKPALSPNSNMSKGGIALHHFLDLNHNLQRDPGEPKIAVKKVSVPRGKQVYDKKDTTLRIFDLNAFDYTLLRFQAKELPSIAWWYQQSNCQIYIDPHKLKEVYIPIAVMGEVRGYVLLDEKKSRMPKVALHIYDFFSDQKVGEIYSESDGYFEFLGLPPGKYRIRLDSNQLKKLRLKASNEEFTFSIRISEEGDSVELPDILLLSDNQ